MQIARPIHFGRLTGILRINGASVYVHWSVFAIATLMLLGALRKPIMTIIGIVCYLSVLLIHECGHMVVAQRLGCRVEAIELYPIHGRCLFQRPWSRFDHCLIASGGVVAQAVVALPLVAWLAFFGYTRFDAVNAVLAILGCFSLGVALLNLLPAGRLDGAIAWGLIPEWIKRAKDRLKKQKVKRTTGGRRY